MPTVSASQKRLMEAAAHTPGGYGGVPQAVGKEFIAADTEPFAAGIIFEADGKVLLIKRSDNGLWAFPGGHINPSETPKEAASRECFEEVGYLAEPSTLQLVGNYDGFVTFSQYCDPFTPAINHESSGYGWFGINDMPPDLLPEALPILTDYSTPKTELDHARLIRCGAAPSPQYVNNHWLFDLRITGTGEAYRASLGQGVYRPPENYLNPEFLARCNGLPVTWEHPEKNKLNSEEFGDRIIGTIMLPYIKNDEVWGIARIYDETAADEMSKGELSTSPSIIFKNIDNTYDKENNTVLEGNGSLIDHLAICNVGVWDKGGPPSGVNVNNNGVKTMDNEEEKKETTAAGEGEDTSERLLKLLESMDARLSKIEAAEKAEVIEADEETEKEEEKEAEEAFADSAEFKELKAKIALLENAAPRHRSNDDFNALAIAQNAAETVYSAFGDSVAVTRPMDGETVLGYRKRMVKGLQKHATGRHATIDVGGIADEALLSMVEEAVYADALQVARAPTSNGLPNGLPRAVKGVDEVGRPFIHYTGGDPLAVFKPFRQQPRQVVGLRDTHTQH